MLTCKDTARLLAQEELGASRLQRIELRVHLLMCRFCRRYKAQLRAIGEACREPVGVDEEDSAALARLERSLLDEHRR